jgi:hypothetical protein
MEITNIPQIAALILSLMQPNRNYTFDKLAAILYANDYDVDSFRLAQGLIYAQNYMGLFTIDEAEGAVFFNRN